MRPQHLLGQYWLKGHLGRQNSKGARAHQELPQSTWSHESRRSHRWYGELNNSKANDALDRVTSDCWRLHHTPTIALSQLSLQAIKHDQRSDEQMMKIKRDDLIKRNNWECERESCDFLRFSSGEACRRVGSESQLLDRLNPRLSSISFSLSQITKSKSSLRNGRDYELR